MNKVTLTFTKNESKINVIITIVIIVLIIITKFAVNYKLCIRFKFVIISEICRYRTCRK